MPLHNAGSDPRNRFTQQPATSLHGFRFGNSRPRPPHVTPPRSPLLFVLSPPPSPQIVFPPVTPTAACAGVRSDSPGNAGASGHSADRSIPPSAAGRTMPDSSIPDTGPRQGNHRHHLSSCENTGARCRLRKQQLRPRQHRQLAALALTTASCPFLSIRSAPECVLAMLPPRPDPPLSRRPLRRYGRHAFRTIPADSEADVPPTTTRKLSAHTATPAGGARWQTSAGESRPDRPKRKTENGENRTAGRETGPGSGGERGEKQARGECRAPDRTGECASQVRR